MDNKVDNKVDNKKKKKIMTDLAAGHISKIEAEDLIEAEKTPQIKPKQESEEKDTHKRKKASKSREVK